MVIKNFSKVQDEEKGVFSFKQVKKILKEVMESQSLIQDRCFPKELTLCKIFLYSLTSGKNKFDIECAELLEACRRFGAESPFPFIK
jgi:hypothetical protein